MKSYAEQSKAKIFEILKINILFILIFTVKIFSLCFQIFPCVTAKFPVFSLSGKSKNQIPCFPCVVATLLLQALWHWSWMPLENRYAHFLFQNCHNSLKARTHSGLCSRMCTAHCGSCAKGLYSGKGVSVRDGRSLSRGSVSGRWRLCPGGSVSGKGVSVIETPPPRLVARMTHACENITFPQLRLRAVIIREK